MIYPFSIYTPDTKYHNEICKIQSNTFKKYQALNISISI